MKTFISFYTLKLPLYFVYMLQQVEYDPAAFLVWLDRVIKQNKKINSVMTRKKLVITTKARSLILFSYSLSLLLITALVVLLYDSSYIENSVFFLIINLIVLLITLPYFILIALVIVTYLAMKLIVVPKNRSLIAISKAIFANHKGVKVAVIGSYGKTTMKELLTTIISEGKQVAATPGNMNTAVSHARFAKKLQGNEDVLIVEFGEGKPGDVAGMSDTLCPDYAVVTGLAPNHLDHYASLDAVADDLLSVLKYAKPENVYVTQESKMLKPYITHDMNGFSASAVMGWTISDILISVKQTSFIMKKGTLRMSIISGLLGRHQVAPVAFGAALAHELGLTTKQIEKGCQKIQPFEHRMQPRYVHGAWLLDDTYNGNLEGLQAGLSLLGELDMKRKWYVTPGLVDQGTETERVHKELGKSIAAIHPDIVVLMENSARPIIEKSMKKHGYKGELRIETNPLEFYTTIEHIVVAGDLLLMQNDWTDNYV